MIAAVLLATACAAPFIARRLSGDLFPPAAIVVTMWAGTLGLLALSWLPYLPISTDTWWLLSTTGVVLLGTTLAGAWAGERWSQGPRRVVMLGAAEVWVLVYALLGLAGLAWYVYSVVSRFGWIFGNGQELRYHLWTLAIPSHYLFLQQFCSATGLLTWSLLLTGARIGRVPLAMAVAASAATLATTDRTQFFSLVATGVFMYLLRHGPRLPIRRILLLTVGAPALLVANFLVIGAWTGKTTSGVSVRLRWPGAEVDSARARLVEAVQGGAVLYVYATASYPALSQYLETEHQRTKGAHTLFPVARLLQRAGLWPGELPPAIPAFVTIGTREDGLPLTTNVYTFLFYPLEDFGPTGALFYAAAVGVVCGWAYGWARTMRESPARLLVAGQVCTALALTFFVNKFNNTAWWYVLACTVAPFVVTRLMRRHDSAA